MSLRTDRASCANISGPTKAFMWRAFATRIASGWRTGESSFPGAGYSKDRGSASITRGRTGRRSPGGSGRSRSVDVVGVEFFHHPRLAQDVQKPGEDDRGGRGEFQKPDAGERPHR